MENITIPCGEILSGEIAAISSKSDLHRLIICGALSDKGCKIKYASMLSKDITATIGCLRALGAEITVDGGIIEIVKPIDADNIPQNAVLDCIESGSTARFMLPVIALLAKNATLTGSGKLPERPFADLCEALRKMGAILSSDTLPIKIIKCAEPEGYFETKGNISSQYITGLLFILPLCNAMGIKLTTELESGGYINLTADAMKRFGVDVSFENGVYTTKGKYSAPTKTINAEGDWSNSSFWLCATKNGGSLTVTGLNMTSSQPDRRICEILTEMGMEITFNENSVTASLSGKTRGISIDARNIPDLVPILAVRAAISEGNTVISGINRLRLKESDRVQSVCSLINDLGGKARFDESNIYIEGMESLCGGTAQSCNDHRIAMSAAIAATFCSGNVTIVQSDAVNKSYPEFFKHREMLSGIPQKG